MANIILTGFMGSGKTVVGRRLAKRLGWRFVDVDKVIEAGAGTSIAAIFAKRGEGVFRRLERRHIVRIVRNDHQVIATGGGTFIDPANRERLRARGTVVCLTARPRVILARAGRRIGSRPLLDGKGNPMARIRTLLAQRARSYAQADLTLDTSDLSIDAVVDRLMEQLGPCVCRSWQYLLDHAKELSHRYAGQYVVVMGNRIIASGQTQLEAYQKIPGQRAGQDDAGIYYIPLPEESLTAF